MRLPDGSTLMHAKVPYDPAKAHEYYLRNRKLKGRKGSAGSELTKSVPTKKAESFTVKVGNGKTVKLSPKQLSEQKAHAAARVAFIKKKLGKLNSELKKRMAEARKSERDSKKPDSSAEKADAARESAKYRDKHAQELASKGKKASSTKKEAPGPDTVEGLKRTIDGVQKSLAAAVARQRSLTSATKNG